MSKGMGVCEVKSALNKDDSQGPTQEIANKINDNIPKNKNGIVNKQYQNVSNNNKEKNSNVEKGKEKNEANKENKIKPKEEKDQIKEKEKIEQSQKEKNKEKEKEKENNKPEEKKIENEQKKEAPPKNEEKNENKENKEAPPKNEEKKENKENKPEKIIKQENIITKDIIPRGLNNIGSTCYMNSVIQCLYHIFDLSNELCKLYKNNILNDEILKKLPLTYVFLDVITDLSFGKKKSISPYNFKEIIGKNKSFREYEANDSKNLTLYILDTLNQEMNDNKIRNENDNYKNKIFDYKENDTKDIIKYYNENHNSLIGDLFTGLKSTNFQCLRCKNCVRNYQIYNIFTCNVEKAFMNKYKNSKKKYIELKIDILDCFKVEQEPNLFTGDNQLFCEKCNKLNDGASFNKICTSPKILILFLDRGVNNRFNCDVDFPEKLDINDFLEVKGNKYELIGTIEHLGPSGQSGHFIANCKHFDNNWYIFSDSSISTTKNKYIKYGLPYLVFYRMED